MQLLTLLVGGIVVHGVREWIVSKGASEPTGVEHGVWVDCDEVLV